MKISVIVPFFNPGSSLSFLMKAIENQSFRNDFFEIIFINNCSNDRSNETIKDNFNKSDFNFKILEFNDFPSSYASRNTGVKKATGDILVFTDADCIPSPTWLENIAGVYSENKNPNLVVSGKVELEIEDKKNPWELFDHHFHMDNRKAEKNARVATANMAVRKNFFEKAGYFEEVTSGADHRWSELAKAAGAEIKYYPEVLVLHPTRKTKDQIIKKVKRTSYGLGEMSSKNPVLFFKGTFKTLFRPLLFHRHLKFAFSEDIMAGLFFRIKLFVLSFTIRCYQVPAFFKGVLHQ